ncbi:DNA polymerase III subunit beta [Proteobacteria bacterium 005FR1]|nr:DNA polymerase III subunit beta [Proteobacteria bacterium 005FR1]
MKFTVSREELLKPLQMVVGVVERRQTLPVLANVLVVLEGDRLSLTGTDLEVEIVARVGLAQPGESGETTVPAKKFADICRSLPEGAEIHFTEEEDKVILRSGSSRFTLSTLPASNFPNVEQGAGQLRFTCAQSIVKQLIDSTAFAMAQQDVRYYLNGMLWEVRDQQLRCVATDGHRLAMCTKALELPEQERIQAIVPRKGILELGRMLLDEEAGVEITIGDKHMQVATDAFTFTSKLVDGKFPDYERVLPRGGNNILFAERQALRQAFSRVAILSNEKYRGVRITLSDGNLVLVANNPEQDEAEEQLAVDYTGESLKIGFNISYLLDVTNVLHSDRIKASFVDANTSALIEEPEGGEAVYVIMPMRL